MTKEEIYGRCLELYDRLSKAQKELKELRETCKHENTFEGNYETRAGQIHPSIICSWCNKLIKTIT